jgi:hypothetical protein
VAGPELTLEDRRELSNVDRSGAPGRMDLFDGRKKNDVDAMSLRGLDILLLATRIGPEVLAGAELQRVHEDAHHDRLALVPRRAHQREMPRVQSAHGRHESDIRTCAARVEELGAKLAAGVSHLHPRSSTVSIRIAVSGASRPERVAAARTRRVTVT